MLVKVNQGNSVVYPYSRALAAKDFPNVSFPIVMTPENWAVYSVFLVNVLSPENYDPQTHTMVRHSQPKLNEERGEWELGYDLLEISEEEMEQKKLSAEISGREIRDALLGDSDVWALSDRTMTAEQIAYRQALRDITNQDGFPFDIDWPAKP